jgi:hypothetical protein
MPRIGGAIQAAVPSAEELGVRTGGVGCEVDYAHLGLRGRWAFMCVRVCRTTGSCCCSEGKVIVICALVGVVESES